MFVLGLNGSPRKKGNTDYLLSQLMENVKKRGGGTRVVSAAARRYEPCIGCGQCERTGLCAIDNSLETELFPLFRRADIMVLASPVYFYAVPAWIKAIIDRTQTLWSRKYRLGLKDPGHDSRKGILLSVGATHGKDLFDGIKLTAKYFFDAAGADFTDSLCYRGIDHRGGMADHPGAKKDMAAFADKMLTPFEKRKTVLFACRENAGRSQMAAGFARRYAGDRFDVISAGSAPGEKLNPVAVEAMAETGMDLAFINPQSIDRALEESTPDWIVTMGCGESCPVVSGSTVVDWDLADPAGKSLDEVRQIRDEIEKRVGELLSTIA